VAEHCGSVLVREEVRAGPSIGGGTAFVRVRCRLRGARDMNLELVLVPYCFVREGQCVVGMGWAP
jgi:hypothetical protein